MLQNKYQVSFFDYLYDRSGYKRTDHFAEEVAAALYISRSGAYKKIRAISVSDLFAGVMRKVHSHESISNSFVM